MAVGDIVESAINSALNTTVGITLPTSPVAQNNLILLFCTARNGTNTVSTAPSGYTLLNSVSGTNWPISYLYGKIAGVSESNTPSITWSSSDYICMIGYVFQGTLSLSNVTSSVVDLFSGTSMTLPATPLTSSGKCVAIAYHAEYQNVTAVGYTNSFTLTYDNYFVNIGRYGCAQKIITGADSNIQTVVSWTSTAGADGIMAVVEPPSGISIPVIMNHLRNQGIA